MSDGREAAFAAVGEGDWEGLAELLREDPDLVGARGDSGATLLHVAAERDDARSTRVLLEHGADPDTRSGWGQTSLEWAANLGSRTVADTLRGVGASGARLWTAAALGRLDEVRACFDDGRPRAGVGRVPHPRADLSGWPEDTAFRSGDVVSDAFYIACRRGHADVARFLAERGADVDALGYFGASALHWAALEGHDAIVRWLVASGAGTLARDPRFDATPAGWAREGGHVELAAYLDAVTS